VWEAAGSKTSGTWEQVFGKGAATDEVFMAWNYARYIDHVTAAGDPPQQVALGGYTLEVSYPRGRAPVPQLPRRAAARFISMGPDEYLAAGSGPVSVTFSPNTPGPPIAGIAYIDEGTYVNGRWTPGRRLNGDENSQRKALRIGVLGRTGGIQRVKLYRYR
jgi:hypothetical protein